MSRVVRAGAVSGALALSVVAGTLSGPAAATTPAPADPALAAPVGDATAIAPGVDWRSTPAGTYAAVAGTQPVAVGDGVRTDATGFAEVAYRDGSRTRLDVDTEFEVVSLADSAGTATTRTQMGLGRTWHRVQTLGSASGGFVVETSQATATVLGTAFMVSCPTADSCAYSVMEGAVEVALVDGTVVTVTAPATLTVTGGVPSGPVPLAWDGLFGDEWLVANTDRDVEAGFADRATVFSAYGPAFASMVGDYAGTDTLTDLTCNSFCIEGIGTPDDIGLQFDFSASLGTDCSGSVCAIVGASGVPYAFDGTAHRASIPADPSPCEVDWENDGVMDEVSGNVLSTDEFVLTALAAEVRDGAFVATEMSRTLTRVDTVEGYCVDGDFGPEIATIDDLASLPQYLGLTAVYEAVATRQ